jgi:hypothetical protein
MRSSPGITGDVSKNTTIKARAFKQGWLGSEVAEFTFYKNTFVPGRVELSAPLFEKFPALGTETFFNKQLGGMLPYGDKWAGITKAPVKLYLSFNQLDLMQSVQIHILVNPEIGAFPPAW